MVTGFPSASLCAQGFLPPRYAPRVFFRLVMLPGFPSASILTEFPSASLCRHGFLPPLYAHRVSFSLFILTRFHSASLCSMVSFSLVMITGFLQPLTLAVLIGFFSFTSLCHLHMVFSILNSSVFPSDLFNFGFSVSHKMLQSLYLFMLLHSSGFPARILEMKKFRGVQVSPVYICIVLLK
jgi:hypothetical protein